MLSPGHFLGYIAKMKFLSVTHLLAALIILTSCQTTEKKTMNQNTLHPFYIGTYTNTESQGIYKYLLHTDGSIDSVGLAVKTENPSFLAMSADGKFLIAVNEIDTYENAGSVESYLVSTDTLKLMNRRPSGGAHPCFVAINAENIVLTANYSGGNVGLFKLSEQGRLSDLLDLQQHEGKGTTERQAGPHAHSVWFQPDQNRIIAVDLGTNQLWFSSLDQEQQKFIAGDPQILDMDPGAGPRHLVFHPNGKWIYVANELTSTVSQVNIEESGYSLGASFSSLPAGYAEPNTCADIKISADGQFIYASNRGHNSIAVFQIDPVTGNLKLLGNKACGGDGPRNIALSPDENFLLVANQHSNNIVTLKRDKTSGLLRYSHQTEAPTPVCIVF